MKCLGGKEENAEDDDFKVGRDEGRGGRMEVPLCSTEGPIQRSGRKPKSAVLLKEY